MFDSGHGPIQLQSPTGGSGGHGHRVFHARLQPLARDQYPGHRCGARHYSTFDSTRDAGDNYTGIPTDGYNDKGMTSFYFGLEDPHVQTRQPAGRHSRMADPDQPGAGTTNQPERLRHLQPAGRGRGIVGEHATSFSLEGYTAADVPTLYFNYFLSTDAVDHLRHGAGVYVSPDGGIDLGPRGHQHRLGQPDRAKRRCQRGRRSLIDANTSEYTGWRQAVVNLGALPARRHSAEIHLRYRQRPATGRQRRLIRLMAPDDPRARAEQQLRGLLHRRHHRRLRGTGRTDYRCHGRDTNFNAVPGFKRPSKFRREPTSWRSARGRPTESGP